MLPSLSFADFGFWTLQTRIFRYYFFLTVKNCSVDLSRHRPAQWPRSVIIPLNETEVCLYPENFNTGLVIHAAYGF
jgi:hypothetical protein